MQLLNASGENAQHDKRREQRFGVRAPATIIPCEKGEERKLYTVVVLDISASGVGIISTLPISPGGRFILNVAARPGQPITVLQCTAAHSRQQANGAFIIGAKFDRLLGGEENKAAPSTPAAVGAEAEDVDSEHLMHVKKALSAVFPDVPHQSAGIAGKDV